MAAQYSYPARPTRAARPVNTRPSPYDGYGRRKPYSCSLPATPIIPPEGCDTKNGKVFHVGGPGFRKPRILREEPVPLSVGVNTEVRYFNGVVAKGCIVLSFIGLIGYGPFAFLALYPIFFSVGVKWMKDIEHIDPGTGEIIGTYYRGFQDAPSVYRYRTEGGDVVDIEFGRQPVLLPDGEMTLTRRRIGARNFRYFMNLAILFFILFFTYFLLGPLIMLLVFVLPCLKDTEHIHPITGEVVGMHYQSVFVISKEYYSDREGSGVSYTINFEDPTY